MQNPPFNKFSQSPLPAVLGMCSPPSGTSARRSRVQKAYKCPFCDKSFCILDRLTAHIQSHSKSKIFVCIYPGCGKRFSSLQRLVHHTHAHPTAPLEETEGVFDSSESEQAIVRALKDFSLPDFFHSRTLPVPGIVQAREELMADLVTALGRYTSCPKVPAKH